MRKFEVHEFDPDFDNDDWELPQRSDPDFDNDDDCELPPRSDAERRELYDARMTVSGGLGCPPGQLVPLIQCQIDRALWAEQEVARLQKRVDQLEGLKPELPPFPPDLTPRGTLQRYGLRWPPLLSRPGEPLAVPMDDGYWTPWHQAKAYIDELARRYELANSEQD